MELLWIATIIGTVFQLCGSTEPPELSKANLSKISGFSRNFKALHLIPNFSAFRQQFMKPDTTITDKKLLLENEVPRSFWIKLHREVKNEQRGNSDGHTHITLILKNKRELLRLIKSGGSETIIGYNIIDKTYEIATKQKLPLLKLKIINGTNNNGQVEKMQNIEEIQIFEQIVVIGLNATNMKITKYYQSKSKLVQNEDETNSPKMISKPISGDGTVSVNINKNINSTPPPFVGAVSVENNNGKGNGVEIGARFCGTDRLNAALDKLWKNE